MTINVPLASAQAGTRREAMFVPIDLSGFFGDEDGAIVMVSMEKLSRRITRDRGGMSSLIDNLDALNDAYRQIDLGSPLMLPVLNSRKREIQAQLLVESGRHQLYALRSRGASTVPVIVPQGLLLQVERELGLELDAQVDAAIGIGNIARGQVA